MRFSLVLLIALLLPSCSNTPDGDTPAPRATDSAVGRAADSVGKPVAPAMDGARPEQMIDTLVIEGKPMTSRLRLLDTGLPFTTYYPEDDLSLHQNRSEEGTALRFEGNFGGKANKEISIHFFFPSVTASLSEMNEYVAGEQGAMAVADWKATGPAAMNCPWANISYLYTDIRQPGTGGAICIGQHHGGAFYMITHYPAEFAGPIETRLARILAQLRWKDTGTELRKE